MLRNAYWLKNALKNWRMKSIKKKQLHDSLTIHWHPALICLNWHINLRTAAVGAGHQTGSCPPYVSSIHTSLRPGWVQSGSAWKRGNDCVGTCAALLMLPPAPQTHTTCTETDGYCLHEMTAQQQQPKKKAEKKGIYQQESFRQNGSASVFDYVCLLILGVQGADLKEGKRKLKSECVCAHVCALTLASCIWVLSVLLAASDLHFPQTQWGNC